MGLEVMKGLILFSCSLHLKLEMSGYELLFAIGPDSAVCNWLTEVIRHLDEWHIPWEILTLEVDRDSCCFVYSRRLTLGEDQIEYRIFLHPTAHGTKQRENRTQIYSMFFANPLYGTLYNRGLDLYYSLASVELVNLYAMLCHCTVTTVIA